MVQREPVRYAEANYCWIDPMDYGVGGDVAEPTFTPLSERAEL